MSGSLVYLKQEPDPSQHVLTPAFASLSSLYTVDILHLKKSGGTARAAADGVNVHEGTLCVREDRSLTVAALFRAATVSDFFQAPNLPAID